MEKEINSNKKSYHCKFSLHWKNEYFQLIKCMKKFEIGAEVPFLFILPEELSLVELLKPGLGLCN